MSSPPCALRLGSDRDRLRIVILVIAAMLAALVSYWWGDGAHGFDERSSSSWREADYVSIARGFVADDLNPLHARVPWRGDTSGEVEMEIPVVPWLAALAGRASGYEDSMLRRISTLFAAGACALFGWLALTWLRPWPAFFAWVVFATNPIVQMMATAMQPEAVMLFWTVLTVLAALRWYLTGSSRWWWIAVASVSLALLSKGSTAYLLPFCGLLVWLRAGFRGLFERRTLISLGLALVAPVLWYARARGIYDDTGLSLGLSNETHLVSLALLAAPMNPVIGNLIHEARFVLGWLGAVPLVVLGILDRRQIPVLCLALSVAFFYVLIADTSGEGWAWYYHLHSVVPAALLAGAGIERLAASARRRPPHEASMRLAPWALAFALCGLVLAGNLHEIRHLRAQRSATDGAFRDCVRELAATLPLEARLLVRGGISQDEHGHPIAFNDSLAFAWAQRLGANFPSDTTGNPFLRYADREPPWFWLTRTDDGRLIADYPRLQAAAAAYPMVARCSTDPGYALVRLTTN